MIQKLRKVIRYKLWKGDELSALETVVYLESVEPDEEEQFREWRKQNFLKELAHREAEEAAYGGGERDWVLAGFAQALTKSPRLQQVYTQMRQGCSSEMIARELGFGSYEVRRAEGKIMALFRSRARSKKTGNNRSPYIRTLNMLRDAPYRTFVRRDRTGTVAYLFYHRCRFLGSAVAYVLPDWPVVVKTADGMIMNTSCHGDSVRDLADADEPSNLVARLTRKRGCPGFAKPAAMLLRKGYGSRRASGLALRIIGKGRGCHQLDLPASGKKVQILSDDHTHRFYMGKQLAAQIQRTLPEKQTAAVGFELMNCMKLYREDLDDTTALLFMVFTVIQFGI